MLIVLVRILSEEEKSLKKNPTIYYSAPITTAVGLTYTTPNNFGGLVSNGTTWPTTWPSNSWPSTSSFTSVTIPGAPATTTTTTPVFPSHTNISYQQAPVGEIRDLRYSPNFDLEFEFIECAEIGD